MLGLDCCCCCEAIVDLDPGRRRGGLVGLELRCCCWREVADVLGLPGCREVVWTLKLVRGTSDLDDCERVGLLCLGCCEAVELLDLGCCCAVVRVLALGCCCCERTGEPEPDCCDVAKALELDDWRVAGILDPCCEVTGMLGLDNDCCEAGRTLDLGSSDEAEALELDDCEVGGTLDLGCDEAARALGLDCGCAAVGLPDPFGCEVLDTPEPCCCDMVAKLDLDCCCGCEVVEVPSEVPGIVEVDCCPVVVEACGGDCCEVMGALELDDCEGVGPLDRDCGEAAGALGLDCWCCEAGGMLGLVCLGVLGMPELRFCGSCCCCTVVALLALALCASMISRAVGRSGLLAASLAPASSRVPPPLSPSMASSSIERMSEGGSAPFDALRGGVVGDGGSGETATGFSCDPRLPAGRRFGVLAERGGAPGVEAASLGDEALCRAWLVVVPGLSPAG